MSLVRRALIGLCLLVPLVGLVVWVRGWFIHDLIECRWTESYLDAGGSGYRLRILRLELLAHALQLEHSANWQPGRTRSSVWHYSAPAAPTVHGFYSQSRPHPSGHDWVVRVPTWLLFTPALIPLAAQFDRRFRARRRTRLIGESRCPDCGYDLRASKDRCPECGRPISSA